MEQARNYVCKECSSSVPSGHKFCGACGASVPDEIQHIQTKYFGALQQPGRARLFVIRGDEGSDGLHFLLNGPGDLDAGRDEGQILFTGDRWVSPKHAKFIYRADKLVVRDEGSVNGVYLRIKGPATLPSGAHFLCGEQVFRFESSPADDVSVGADGTYFYSSPKRANSFRVTQILTGGRDGMCCVSRDNVLRIGREDSDMNYPEDIYMSGTHARVEASGGGFVLHDEGSRNGTYLRIDGERELSHGDYLFLGRQLLRVEMTT